MTCVWHKAGRTESCTISQIDRLDKKYAVASAEITRWRSASKRALATSGYQSAGTNAPEARTTSKACPDSFASPGSFRSKSQESAIEASRIRVTDGLPQSRHEWFRARRSEEHTS